MALIVFLMLLIVPAAPGQQRDAARKPGVRAAAKSRPCATPSDPQACERGWQLIDAGETEASGIRESGTRAYAQRLVARTYASSDRKKAVELLDTAFTATLILPDGNQEGVQGKIEAIEKTDLQQRVMESLVILAPGLAEEKLPLAFPSIREPVFTALIEDYKESKRLDDALQMVNRIARDSAFPYVAAGRLMAVLPTDKTAERTQLFTDALNSFRAHPPAGNGLQFDAGVFPMLIVQHWRGLPAPLVREAIDEILKQAKTNGEHAQPMRLTVDYGRGERASLASLYEYRLFLLLPVLREIDPSSAESLLRDHEAVAKQLDAYVQAGSPPVRFVGGSRSVAPQARVGVRGPGPEESSQDVVQRIMTVKDVVVRARFLLGTARRVQGNDPSTAKACLDKVVDPVAEQLPSAMEQVSSLAEAASLYMDLKDAAGAAKAISEAEAAADKLYALDNDPDNPNRAQKAYWPSTSSYLRIVRLAGRLSPDLALGMIKGMRDEEIRPLMRLALGCMWIGVPMGELTVIRKDGASSQESDPEAQR